MNGLIELEGVANQIGSMFSHETPISQTSPETAVQSSGEVKLEIERLKKEAERQVAYFQERAAELEGILNSPILPDGRDFSAKVLRSALIFSELDPLTNSTEANRQKALELNDAYKQTVLSEAGFQSYEEVSAQISALCDQRWALTGGLFGALFHIKEIKALDRRRKSLEDLSRSQYNYFRLTELSYSTRTRFEEAQAKVFEKFAIELVSRYRSLSEDVSGTDAGCGRLAPDILKSLTEDYISEYFRAEAEGQLKANREGTSSYNEDYRRKLVEVLGNPELVNEALLVLREGLSQRRTCTWDDPEDVREKTKALNEKVDSLPYALRCIVTGLMMKGNKTIDDEFNDFAGYLAQAHSYTEKKRISNSLVLAKKQVVGAMSGYDSQHGHYSYIGSRIRSIEGLFGSVQGLFGLQELSKFFDGIDMRKWDVFTHNAEVQELYGKSALDSFNNLMRDDIFERLLVTPEHTDESVKLGYRAVWFKDPVAVAYNVMNFWREPGHSGEMPFLSIHSASKDTIAAKYITSLTPEQLHEVEMLCIPGLMDIIHTVRENTGNFTAPALQDGEEWVENPVYGKIQESLVSVCSYYIEHGTREEKYFAFRVALGVSFARSNEDSPRNKGLVKILSKALCLDEHVQSTFMKHTDIFVGRLRVFHQKQINLESHTGDLVALSDFIEYTSGLIQNSKVGDILKAEQKRVLEGVAYSSDLTGLGQRGSEYLRALDDEKTAKRFDSFDNSVRESVQNVAYAAYGIDSSMVLPLIRKVVEKEQSQNRISSLNAGLGAIEKDADLKQHVVTLFQEQPNAGYDILSAISLASPLLDQRFYENVSQTFHNGMELAKYELSDAARQGIQEAGLSEDADVLSYCSLMQTQGKKIQDKNVLALVKLKGQITAYEGELRRKENETVKRRLDEKRKKVDLILREERTRAIHSYVLDCCSRALENVIGEPAEAKDIDEDLINAILVYNKSGSNRALLSTLIKDSLKGCPLQIYDDARNQEALGRYASMGVNTNVWLSGIKRTYTPSRVEDVASARESKIEAHRTEAMNLYSRLGIEVTEEDIFEAYEKVKQMSGVDEDVKRDLKTQLNAIKSLENATYNSKEGDVTIYVEQNPLRVLQMGNVVSGSCLGSGNGNECSTVANAADVNKRVLYAVMNGEIVGRKLIALTDEGRIVQFRTYNNRLDLDIDSLFRQYLSDFSEEANARLANDGNVSQIVSEQWYDDGIVPFAA